MSGLTPEPMQLHRDLERWETYVNDLEKKLESLAAEAALDQATLRSEIVQLTTRLNTVSAPYEQQLLQRDAQIKTLQIQIRNLETAQENAMNRLANLVEVPAGAKGNTMDSLISDLVVLVSEAKTQFRQSL